MSYRLPLAFSQPRVSKVEPTLECRTHAMLCNCFRCFQDSDFCFAFTLIYKFVQNGFVDITYIQLILSGYLAVYIGAHLISHAPKPLRTLSADTADCLAVLHSPMKPYLVGIFSSPKRSVCKRSDEEVRLAQVSLEKAMQGSKHSFIKSATISALEGPNAGHPRFLQRWEEAVTV